MDALVTGGAGFVGSHIVDALVERGYDVLVVDSLVSGKKENVHHNALLIPARVQDAADAIIGMGRKFDLVVHAAAVCDVLVCEKEPMVAWEENYGVTLAALRIAKECGAAKFVFTSTCSVYGEVAATGPVNEVGPDSTYGRAKFASECYATDFCRDADISLLMLRFANVYGPRQRPDLECGVVPIWMGLMLNGNKDLGICGDGSQTRDFVYVKDVVNVIMGRMHAKQNEIVPIGTGVETKVSDLAKVIWSVCGGNGSLVSHELPRSSAEILRSKVECPDGLTPVPLMSGLEQTWEWIKESAR